MYAIIEDGGQQFMVHEGDTIEVGLRPVEKPGQSLQFDRVLMIGGEGAEAKIGQPYVAGASVSGSFVREVKGPKLVVQKLRRRKNSRTRTGHRQHYLQIKIDKIKA